MESMEVPNSKNFNFCYFTGELSSDSCECDLAQA